MYDNFTQLTRQYQPLTAKEHCSKISISNIQSVLPLRCFELFTSAAASRASARLALSSAFLARQAAVFDELSRATWEPGPRRERKKGSHASIRAQGSATYGHLSTKLVRCEQVSANMLTTCYAVLPGRPQVDSHGARVIHPPAGINKLTCMHLMLAFLGKCIPWIPMRERTKHSCYPLDSER
jgi:hypothetical protein